MPAFCLALLPFTSDVHDAFQLHPDTAKVVMACAAPAEPSLEEYVQEAHQDALRYGDEKHLQHDCVLAAGSAVLFNERTLHGGFGGDLGLKYWDDLEREAQGCKEQSGYWHELSVKRCKMEQWGIQSSFIGDLP